jgi:FKBP-type peptidyl-prolyl cis-trans isomerase FkpA
MTYNEVTTKSFVIVVLLITLYAVPAIAAETLKTEEQKTLYAIGLSIGRTLAPFSLTPAELDIVKQGLTDSITGKKPSVELSAYNNKIQEMARARRKAQGEKMAPQNKAALDKAASEKGAVKTASGMVYVSLKEGSGTSPTATDTVRVNYRGTLPDGKEFDSSAKRGKPLEFKMDSVIKCWTEGVQKMKPGGKAKLVCPASLAYGDNGSGDLILPGATLLFEIELLEVVKK